MESRLQRRTDRENAPAKPEQLKPWQRFNRFLKRFGKWAGWVFLLVAFVFSFLAHFHLLPEEYKIIPSKELFKPIALVIALLFVMSTQVEGYNEEINSVADKLKERFEELDERFEEMDRNVSNVATLFAPQLKLSQCIEKLKETFNTMPPDTTLSIRHISLDMQYAWNDIRDQILETLATQRRKVTYQLLIVCGDPDRFPAESTNLQKEMEQMSNRATGRLETIKTYFDDPHMARSLIDVEIRTYTSLPVVHGVYVNQPIPVHYVALSGWRGSKSPTYHWGEGHYYEIKGSPHPSTSTGDIANLFDSQFEHLWTCGTNVYRRTAGTGIPLGRPLGDNL